MVSRKVIMFVVALLTATVTFLQKECGISVSAGDAAAALMVLATYIFGEFKSDMNRVKTRIYEEKKWLDPAFWTALVAGIMPVISQNYGLDLPVEGISTGVAFILGLVFRSRVNHAKKDRIRVKL